MCARLNAAELRRRPLPRPGVKGSPVQIRPSRLVIGFFRMYLYLKRARKRANLVVNGPLQACNRSWSTTSCQGICRYGTASDVG
jgi:hypothetical protein